MISTLAAGCDIDYLGGMVFGWDIILQRRESHSGTTIVALVTNVGIIQNLVGSCRHLERITSQSNNVAPSKTS